MVDRGWTDGSPGDYDREYAVDLVQLRAFLEETQPEIAEQLGLAEDGPSRRRFLARLQGEITSPGSWTCCETACGPARATWRVEDAVEQYRRDRDPRELLFTPGRCITHFAVDDQRVQFCTELAGKRSWFLPFDKGLRRQSPNPDGLMTDYLWRETLSPGSLTEINRGLRGAGALPPLTPARRRSQAARRRGGERRRAPLPDPALGRHGKPNSIAWLAQGLIELERDGAPAFDSVIVVTDRRILDKQIKTVKQFAQVSATVGHAQRSGDLREFIEAGKKIIVSTIQKLPSSSTRSARTTPAGASRSSSTRRTRARVARPRRR